MAIAARFDDLMVALDDGRPKVVESRSHTVLSLYREPAATLEPPEWPALQFRDVFKIFSSGVPASEGRSTARLEHVPAETVALRGLDLEVQPREMVAILGPSGCGKSTLLHLAAGLDTPSAGEVRSFGRSLARLDGRELAAYRARGVAIVFQADNLWPTMSAEENVAAQLLLAGHDDAWPAAREALVAFGLGGRRSHCAAALSGGEVQRVAIAAAAAGRAPLVLADEPTGELDLQNEAIVLDELKRLREEFGSTVVVVTHSARVAEAVDRVIEMRDGRVV